jgi:hypothetical protein
MTHASEESRTRRDELLARCQRERYELVAATATARAMFPRARRMAHWVRALSRMLRVISASLHRP